MKSIFGMRLWMAGGLMATTGCAFDYSFFFPPLDVAANVDLERYLGKWYQIAAYPAPFQSDCAGATAEYSFRDDGKVRVFNTCLSAEGDVTETIEGYAEVADPQTNAKLSVYFPGSPFGAPYWIIELDPDYQYAVVGEPSRSFLWILSRTPTLDEAVLQAILDRLPEQGYDPGGLIFAETSAYTDSNNP